MQLLFRRLQSFFSVSSTRIVTICIFVFLTSFLLQYGFSQRVQRNVFSLVESLYFDYKLKKRGAVEAGKHVAIIGIGEASMSQLGRFPFRRRVYGEIVKRLHASGARVIAFDLLFSETEESGDYKELSLLKQDMRRELGEGTWQSGILDKIDKLVTNADDDLHFARAIPGEAAVVLGYHFNVFTDNGEINPTMAFRHMSAEQKAEVRHRKEIFKPTHLITFVRPDYNYARVQNVIYTSAEPILPITKLFSQLENGTEKKVSFGFFNTMHDSDGIIRLTPLLSYYNSAVYASLALNAAAYYINPRSRPQVELSGFGFENLVIVGLDGTPRQIPIDSRGQLWINYLGTEGTVPTYELVDVLDGRVDPKVFSGKIVFIGTTERTLGDNKAVPLSASFPGVEVNASITNSIVEQNYFYQGLFYFFSGFFSLTLGAIFFGWLLTRLSPLLMTLATLISVGGILFIDQRYFFSAGLIVPALWPSLQYTCMFLGLVIYKFTAAERDKRFVEMAFSRFVSTSVAEQILHDHDKLKIGGEKRELTVLFSDIQNFTELAEKMDANVVSEFLNYFFTAMTKIILDNRGTLDKYIGDSVMCFWGAPLREARHAQLACKTALAMQKEVERVNAVWSERLHFTIKLRIGINTGEMSVGNMGSEQIFDYTVLGDSVNLGSRFEGINKDYGTGIIVGFQTYSQCSDRFLFRSLDRIQVRGRDEATEIYELVGNFEESGDKMEWVETFSQARSAFALERYSDARMAFETCLQMNPADKASQVYLQRISTIELGGDSAKPLRKVQ